MLLGLAALATTSRSVADGDDTGIVIELVRLGAEDGASERETIATSAASQAADLPPPAADEVVATTPALKPDPPPEPVAELPPPAPPPPEPVVADQPPAPTIAPTPSSPPRAPAPTAASPQRPRPRAVREAAPRDGTSAMRAGAAHGVDAGPALIAARPAAGAQDDSAPPVVTTVQYRETPTPPVYPRRARDLQISGTAILRALVDREGRTREVRIWRSSGSEYLDEAAAVAARRWAFAPAQRDGRAIEAWVEIPVHFHLR